MQESDLALEHPSRLLPAHVIDSINLWAEKIGKYEHLDFKKKLRKCKKKLKLKYKPIANGKTRIIYNLKNGYILKVAVTEWGLKSNLTESQIYAICPPSLKKYLCPVISVGHGWIIMRKMKSKTPVTKKYRLKLKQLRTKFLEQGIKPNDLFIKNVMLNSKGKIVIVDYGNFSFVGEENQKQYTVPNTNSIYDAPRSITNVDINITV